MRALLLVGVVLVAGCATPDPFRENVEELIRCERRIVDSPKLTDQQVRDLWSGCFSLYDMRRRRSNAELRAWDDFGMKASR